MSEIHCPICGSRTRAHMRTCPAFVEGARMLTKEQSQFICGLPTAVWVNYIADMVSGDPAMTPSTFYLGMDSRMRDVDPVEVFDLIQKMIKSAYMEILRTSIDTPKENR